MVGTKSIYKHLIHGENVMSSSATTTETTEGIEEISGIGTETGGEAGAQEAGEEAVLNDMHTPVSKPRTWTTGTSTTCTSTTGTSTTGTSTTGTSTTGSPDEAGDEADTEA